MLHEHFKPNMVEKDFSLAISTGRNGARLTHNHARQFQYGKNTSLTVPLPTSPSLSLVPVVRIWHLPSWYSALTPLSCCTLELHG